MKRGFTLSEVLITIAVVGIVAALTLPNLVAKYQERQVVSKLKKVYSILQQSLLYAIKDNGTVDEWTYHAGNSAYDSASARSATEFASYFKPYLKIAKDCGVKPGCLTTQNYLYLNNSKVYANYNNSNKYYKMILTDGTTIFFRTTSDGCVIHHPNVLSDEECAEIFVDVNGKHSPNQYGRDLFTFSVLKNRIVPGLGGACSFDASGGSCSEVVLRTEKMDYLRAKKK